MKTGTTVETKDLKTLQGKELASFPSRTLAIAVDVIIAAMLFVLFVSPVERALIRLGVLKNDRQIVLFFFMNWYSVLWLVLYFGLATYWGKGRTPGKRMARIRVVSWTGRNLTLWQCVERSLGYGFSILEFGFGFFQYFIHPNRRPVHDRVAETVVVRETPRNRSR